MRTQTFAVGEIADQSFVSPGRPVREIEFSPSEDLPTADLVEMYVNIEATLGHRRRLVILFASMSQSHGSEQIARDLAWVGASVLGRRILLLTSIMPPYAVSDTNEGRPSGNFNFTNWNQEFVKIEGHEAYLGNLHSLRNQAGTVISATEIDRHLNELSLYFDMIMITPPAFDCDPLGTVLARHVDGHIIVIEAEQTRRFSAIRLREILSRSGQPIIGAVLGGRRNYLPRWLARLL
jgi:hypothetical protein